MKKNIENLSIYKCYKNSKFLSLKHESYFETYEELFSKYKGAEITFVEVGILNGGSLFMWREFFGSHSKIIGVDFNPDAKKWERDGFEIHIGNQSDPKFWESFFAKVGDVDILLDDGGHTNEQQIITASQSLSHIKDGGMVVVEDTHTSYFKDFGNPSRYSFINYSKNVIDHINSRFPSVHPGNSKNNNIKNIIHSISFYESIVAFKIDRMKSYENKPTTNNGITSDALDFRHFNSEMETLSKFRDYLRNTFSNLKKYKMIKKIQNNIFSEIFSIKSKLISRRLKKYF
jgi:hypothetical protein